MTLIRLAQRPDLPAIAQIVERAYAPYIARIGRRPGPMDDDYAGLIRDGRVHLLVSDDVIRGILVLIPEGRTMLLDNIAVDPAAQGSGHGRALMDFAIRTAKTAGCAAIRLYTNEAMAENIALYGRIGFIETHRGTEKGLRRVYMTRRIG